MLEDRRESSWPCPPYWPSPLHIDKIFLFTNVTITYVLLLSSYLLTNINIKILTWWTVFNSGWDFVLLQNLTFITGVTWFASFWATDWRHDSLNSSNSFVISWNEWVNELISGLKWLIKWMNENGRKWMKVIEWKLFNKNYLITSLKAFSHQRRAKPFNALRSKADSFEKTLFWAKKPFQIWHKCLWTKSFIKFDPFLTDLIQKNQK